MLRAETNIPFGNACDLEATAGDIPELAFAPDPHGGPECLWFCLRVHAVGPLKGKVRLTLKHSQNMLGTSKPENLRPVLRRGAGAWERLGAGAVVELPDGRRTISWLVDPPAPHLDLACCYPYGRAEVEDLTRTAGWRCDSIGVSAAARPLVRLSNGGGAAGDSRPGLYIVARQHSGETSGSWVLDGFLRRLAEFKAAAPLCWTVPLSNVDGVEGGDYGKDNFPYDLNRAWGQPPMRHETLVIQRDMQRWKARCRPLLTLDFHAPGATESDGLYTYLPKDPRTKEVPATVLRWAKLFQDALGPEYAAANFARSVNYKSRWETPTFTAFCCESLGVDSVTFEVPYALSAQHVLTRERYQEAGARLAAAVVAQLTEESRIQNPEVRS